jgi:hypothetical protein
MEEKRAPCISVQPLRPALDQPKIRINKRKLRTRFHELSSYQKDGRIFGGRQTPDQNPLHDFSRDSRP